MNEQLERYWLDIIGAGVRPYGSEAAKAAADAILNHVRAYSPGAFAHEFSTPGWACGGWSLEIAHPEERPVESFLLIGSGAGAFEGELRHIGTNSIWRMYLWERFAVVRGDEILAYVSVRSDGDAIPQTLLEGLCEKPHFVVGRDMLESLLRCEREKIVVKGRADTRVLPDAKGRNIVAPLGPEGGKRVLVMGHYDTVYNTVGAYDNASGAAVVMELGRLLSGMNLRRPVEAIAMDGEEFCLAGARAYAAERGEDIDFVVNIDGVGREKILEVWAGNEAFEREVMSVLRPRAEEFKIIYKWPPAPGSDHAPFYDMGLPVAMLTFNDLGILHTKDDVYERSKLGNMRLMVEMVLDILRARNVVE